MAVENWLWYIEWTPAFIGSGMLVGMNVGLSYLFGALLSYGIIGPALVSQGLATGIQPYNGTKWESYIIYAQMSAGEGGEPLSPRYWLLWPGIIIMLCASLAEVFVQYKAIGKTTGALFSEVRKTINNGLQLKRSLASALSPSSIDSTEKPVRWWMWLPGTIAFVILTCVVLKLQYQMDIGTSVIALVFGFILSFMAIQCQGAVDQQPTTAVTKAVQLVLGGVTKTQNYDVSTMQRINITGAQVAGGASVAATELLSDFRVGFLMRTPLRQQFITQILGNIVAIFLSPALFILFVKTYPCIIDANSDKCAFTVPSASAWSAIALAVTSNSSPIPKSSIIFAIILGVFSIIVTAFRQLYLIGDRIKYRVYLPNMTVIGLSMVIPATCYNIVSGHLF